MVIRGCEREGRWIGNGECDNIIISLYTPYTIRNRGCRAVTDNSFLVCEFLSSEISFLAMPTTTTPSPPAPTNEPGTSGRLRWTM